MAFATCPGCRGLNDASLAQCVACGGALGSGAGASSAAGMVGLSAPTETYGMDATSETWTDPDRGKGMAIAALCLSGAGLLIFQGFGLVGLILGIVALAKQPAPSAKPLAVTAVVLGALGVLYGIALAFLFWRVWA